MPPNFQRFLPIILIGALAIFVLPAIMKKHTSGPNAKTKAAQTLEAMNLIDKGEQAYRAAKGRYTSHLADLIAGNKGLAADLAIGLGVQLDVSTDGQSYLAQVEGENLSLVRARNCDEDHGAELPGRQERVGREVPGCRHGDDHDDNRHYDHNRLIRSVCRRDCGSVGLAVSLRLAGR